jgi:hypothetical protein
MILMPRPLLLLGWVVGLTQAALPVLAQSAAEGTAAADLSAQVLPADPATPDLPAPATSPESGDRSARLREIVRARLADTDDRLASLDPASRSRLERIFPLHRLPELLNSESIDTDQLRDVERQFYRLARNLNVEPVDGLRQALTRWANYERIVESPVWSRETELRMQNLDRLLQEAIPDTQRIARHVDWLVTAGVAMERVREVQGRFRHPCIVVDVNPELLQPLLEQYQKEIDEREFTRQQIAGVPVSGTSHFEGRISPRLLENPFAATLQLSIEGTIESPDNRARPDPRRAPLVGNVAVTLQSSGHTSVTGYKDLYWDGTRLASLPARIECETQAELEHVAISRDYRRPNRRLAQRVDYQIRKRAHDEVNRKSDLAAREAAHLAEQQVSSELDAEVREKLAEANRQIDELYRQPLLSLGLLPTSTSRSDARSIRIGFRGTHYGGIGAAEALPVRRPRGDIELSLHESMTTSLWAGYLRGRRLDDRDFRNIHRELRGFVPQALRLAGNPPWAIRLDDEAPLTTSLRQGQIGLQLSCSSLTIDEQTWRYPFSVSAVYRVITELDMPRFERRADVAFTWLQDGPSDPETRNRLREFVVHKFRAFFASQMHMDGMSAPAGGAWGSTAQMKIVDSQIDDGWWRLVFEQRDMNRLQ